MNKPARAISRMAEGGADGMSGVSATLRAPLYHQIYVLLRDGILSGRLKHGEGLPSEHDLARSYGVSRITAKRALDELAEAGLVVRARGRGTTVQYQPPAPPLRSSVSTWLESMATMGRSTAVRVLSCDYGPCGDEEAAALELPAGAEIQRAVRVRSLDGEPLSHLTTAVPAGIGRCFDAAALARTPMLQLLQEAGVVIGHARQVIGATLADQMTAPRLATEIGAPLLRLQRVVRDRFDRPVEYLTALYRPDRYQLTMMLTAEQTLREPWAEPTRTETPR